MPALETFEIVNLWDELKERRIKDPSLGTYQAIGAAVDLGTAREEIKSHNIETKQAGLRHLVWGLRRQDCAFDSEDTYFRARHR